MADAPSPADPGDRFKTGFEAHTLGRDDAIPTFKEKKKRKKKSSKKVLNNHKKRKKTKNVKFDEEKMENLETTDPMRKLYAAHPRHIIKLILKKLCEKPSFYRMLGSLGMALKSSGISLEEFFLSSSNKLPKSTIRDKLRYDINDERMLILARLAVHKMLIREGTTLKSAIHGNGTFPMEYDSDDDHEEIKELPPQHRSLKKGLKYVSNEQFAEKMQSENPQDILNALSYADKHRLYELFKQDLESIEEKEGGPTELHKYCTSHVSNPPQLTQSAIPTIIKYDDPTTWPKITEAIDPTLMGQESVFDAGDGDDIDNIDNIDDDDDGQDINIPDMNGINKVSASTLGVPSTSVMAMNSAKSTFTAPSAKSIYGSEYREEEVDGDGNDVEDVEDVNDLQKSRRSLPTDGDISAYNMIVEENEEMTEIQRKEREAMIKKERKDEMKKEYIRMVGREQGNIDRNVLKHDHDSIIQNTYEYYLDFESWSSPSKDISLLSSLQTQIDILIRYNHIGYKHLSMLLLNKSNLPEMYVSLDRMREWELNRDNEIEILQDKKKKCKEIYGGDIDELNIRKALLAREINESKVSLERIKYELNRMRQLYENAKLELDEVNEVTKQQELQRDAYLTKFDEKWTFEWPVRGKFHRQTKLNDKIKQDAKEWQHKLEDLKKYNESDEIWNKLIEDIWKFGNDNKKMMGHYNKLNGINKSRSIIYNGCIKFWNEWYLNHCRGIFDHSEDNKMLSSFYKTIMLRGTENNIDFEFNRDRTQFEYEWNDNRDIWSYRDYIYSQREKGQIDITATDLDASELWRLVEYQENGDFESYKQFAYPKLYKFEQEQLEIERKEILKELEKQKEKKKSKLLHSKKTKRNLIRAAKKQEKLNKLQEEDEEYEREEEKQYQSQMNMLINNDSNTFNDNMAYRSQPGTPLFNSLNSRDSITGSKPGTPMMSGMSSIGMSMGMTGMSNNNFVGMSTTTINNHNKSNQNINNRVSSPSNFGRQRTGTVSTPTYSAYSRYDNNYASTPKSNYGQTTPLSTFGGYNNYGTQTTFKPSTPIINNQNSMDSPIGDLQNEMGQSLSKFGPIGGAGMSGLISPQTQTSNFDINRNSFSIITPHQKHDKL